MVEQSVKALGIRFQARIQLDLFEELFRRRLVDERLKIPKGLELEFLEPANASEQRIKQAILDYRQYQGQKLESELRRQQERLAVAERNLASRATKKALSEQRVAGKKIAFYQSKLVELCRDHPEPRDARIFPQWYAPVVVFEGGECLVRPMRYHMRPSDRPPSFDQKFDGLYNARRDSLTGFWRAQFGRSHGVLIVKSFFENVALHDYEHRALLPGEPEHNVVVEFEATRPESSDANVRAPLAEHAQLAPTGANVTRAGAATEERQISLFEGQAGSAAASSSEQKRGVAAEAMNASAQVELIVPCVWDHWVAADEPELWSFAAITDDPPPEVRATGHDRCVVALREQNVALWLRPEALRDEELFRLLREREPYVFRHRLAG